jgi:hypothetical protein
MYRITALLSLLVFCFLMVGSLDSTRAGDTRADVGRGDKEFVFTSNERPGAPTLSETSAAATMKADQAKRERVQSSGQQQAGQAAVEGSGSPKSGESGYEVRTRPGRDEKDGVLRQGGESALRSGQSAGQVSNVPGTTGTSPNGTGNFLGTGGIPVFPEDTGKK